VATYTKLGIRPDLNVRLAGSWPGGTFTQPPVSVPVGRFGLGTGGNAHAPDEYLLIDSDNENIAGLVDAATGYAEFLYTFAAIK
ncbi:MAG: twin-arginine translocation pathway signal protein, partial [Blastomonas sp.]|nr:twin-arginine translocation pathway signal protein [Blastomonas sp.]